MYYSDLTTLTYYDKRRVTDASAFQVCAGLRVAVVVLHMAVPCYCFFFFLNNPATPEIYPLSLPDAFPTSPGRAGLQRTSAKPCATGGHRSCGPRTFSRKSTDEPPA